MDTYTFGAWLRRRRQALDWTQAELARRAHCTAAMIRKIEANERKPSRELAESLANALGIPPQERQPFLLAARNAQAVEQLTRVALPSIECTPNNLPAPLTSFINRVNDHTTVVAMLTRDEVRLLTLLGLPGIGKTRLCVQVARNVLSDFPDGVWFVDLASVADPTQVLPTIARVLNISESGALTPTQQIITALKDKRVLLVLDNFEHVLDAARDVVELLNQCRNIKVLATSRVPLHVYGEHEYTLAPMSVPSRGLAPDQLLTYESAQLFLVRVREHQPRFAINSENAAQVAEVCIRLDGVPLALELAAASLRRMTLEQLVTALTDESQWLASLHTPARDLSPRQRTLYNAIAWSYRLLDATTQLVFRHIGVLANSFDLSAATAVCHLDSPSVRAALDTLTDHHLLEREQDRWRMVEMIREFALERLSADERVTAQHRHALHFASLLQQIKSDTARIELDHDNFRAALRWAIRARDGSLALMLCGTLADFWEMRGYLREGLTLAHEVLAISEKVEPHLRIGFLNNVAHLAWNKHDFDAALELNAQSIALARSNGMNNALAAAFNVLARIHIEQGDYTRAEQALRECEQIADRHPSVTGVMFAQFGEIAFARGEFENAQAQSEQALKLIQEQQDRFVALIHTNLAETAMARDDYNRARVELENALPLIHLHVRRQLCFLLSLAGWLITSPHARLSDVRQGVELLRVAEMITERTGAPPSAMYRALNDRRMEMARRKLTDRVWQEAWQRGGVVLMDQVVNYARQQLHCGSK